MRQTPSDSLHKARDRVTIHVMRTSLFLGTALSVFLLSGLASAAKINFQATLDSAQETTPPTVVTGTGKANATYDTDTKKFCVLVEYKDIGGAATSAHIHEGARGTPGPIVMNFNAPFTSPLGEEFDVSATDTATAAIAAKLASSSTAFYVNIHTDADQGGAVRGQLEPGGPEVSCDETPDAGSSGSSGASSGSSGASSGSSGTSGATTTPSDGGTSSSSSSGSSDSSSSCNTTNSSPLSTGGPILLGLALAGAVASRARRKK